MLITQKQMWITACWTTFATFALKGYRVQVAVTAGFWKSDPKYMKIQGYKSTERVRVHQLHTVNYTEVHSYLTEEASQCSQVCFMDSDPELKEEKYMSTHIKYINGWLLKNRLVGRTVP